MAARKPNHPLQRYEKRAGARLCYLPPPTPRAGTRSWANFDEFTVEELEDILRDEWRTRGLPFNDNADM
ncbi:hypothetical protein ELH76_34605 [Rhizobium ruizarguesonis]|nr:hypothetical protein ELH76_34605 [Rhizobium ruizarguesonis]